MLFFNCCKNYWTSGINAGNSKFVLLKQNNNVLLRCKIYKLIMLYFQTKTRQNKKRKIKAKENLTLLLLIGVLVIVRCICPYKSIPHRFPCSGVLFDSKPNRA